MDIVRRAFDAFNDGDWDAAAELADPEVEWHAPEGFAAPDAARFLRGKRTVREMWASFFSVWDEWEMTPGTLLAGQDETVFLPVRFTARGHGSGVPMTMDFFQVYAFRAEKILRIYNHLDRSEAVEAAGLSDLHRRPGSI
ncbi:MAG: nuclear transport factor 2 family protein [Solirubrobacterales bacterium]